VSDNSLVREYKLRELVAGLDQALETLELCEFRDVGDDALALPLRDCFRLESAIRRAADYLAELQYLGRRP